MNIDVERIAKLPQWARDLVERQASRIRSLEAEVTARDTGEGNAWTNAHVETTADFRERRYAPSPFHSVQFNLGPAGDEHDWLECRSIAMERTRDSPDYTGPRALQVMGSDYTLVMPRAANVVWIVNTRPTWRGT